MNPQLPMEVQHERSSYADIKARDTDLLAGWGFDPHEIASLVLPLAMVPERWQ